MSKSFIFSFFYCFRWKTLFFFVLRRTDRNVTTNSQTPRHQITKLSKFFFQWEINKFWTVECNLEEALFQKNAWESRDGGRPSDSRLGWEPCRWHRFMIDEKKRCFGTLLKNSGKEEYGFRKTAWKKYKGLCQKEYIDGFSVVWLTEQQRVVPLLQRRTPMFWYWSVGSVSKFRSTSISHLIFPKSCLKDQQNWGLERCTALLFSMLLKNKLLPKILPCVLSLTVLGYWCNRAH